MAWDSRYWKIGVAVGLCFGAVTAFAQNSRSQATPVGKTAHRLSINDVLDVQHLDHVTLSPDGEWIAVVVQRPAHDGEIYGRNAYEIDPSRNDVWLISRHTGKRRDITNGASEAAGFWCATWSPDGQRLAILSTRPEHGEPRGGDNVRLYVWTRSTGSLARTSDDALMTQTRYGGGLYGLDLRGGGDQSTVAHSCSDDGENAPFLWLDDHRLLTATLPKGQVSGLIDQYQRPSREIARDAARLQDAAASTVHAVGSGGAKLPRDERANSAILRMVDVTTGTTETITTVPTYPFRGALSLSVSPNGHRLAVLATLGALQPETGRIFPNFYDDSWTVERRLGFVDLAPNAPIRWATLPAEGRYPLELYGWSPDGRRVALRGRADPFAKATPLFLASAEDGRTRRLGSSSVGNGRAGLGEPHEKPVIWIDSRHLLVRLPEDKAKSGTEWWLLGTNGRATRVTWGGKPVPKDFWRSDDGHLIGIAGDHLVRLDPARATLARLAQIAGTASIVWPQDRDRPTGQFLIDRGAGGIQMLSRDGRLGHVIQTPRINLVDADLEGETLFWSDTNQKGLFLRQATLQDGKTHDLLALDTFMASIDWGRTQLIAYKGLDGQPLKGAVILPPDYQPGRRYPTLLWVYGGYRVQALEGDYWLDPFLPGFYNLQLYAARGYVVLIPSMPLPSRAERDDVYAAIPNGVLPAIDKLVALGIADPERLGVMGQSFGGYSVYALVTQTDRFKAAVAMAGITDLAGDYGQFDPTARGYPGIEHEKSDNWAEIDLFGRHTRPAKDPSGYTRNSPLSYVDRVQTPLLMIHGDDDVRGSSAQAEQFFYGLYAQGKTARLLRYGGESHSLAQSPANVRDIFAQTIDWFDAYLKPPERSSAAERIR